eukprot:COSAG05_NODE_1169_length_5605_cov_2.698987_4_plen_38_part_00
MTALKTTLYTGTTFESGVILIAKERFEVWVVLSRSCA